MKNVDDHVIKPLLLNEDSFLLQIIEEDREKWLHFSTPLSPKNTPTRKRQKSIMGLEDLLFNKCIEISDNIDHVPRMLVDKKSIFFKVPLFPRDYDFDRLGSGILKAIRWYQTRVHPDDFVDLRASALKLYRTEIQDEKIRALLFPGANHIENNFKKLESQ